MQYVYLLRAGTKHYKVGISHNVRSRVSGLQAHNPEKIEVIATKFADLNAYTIEQELHKFLEKMKAEGANEWFTLDAEQALKLAAKINEYPDIDVSERVTLAEIVNQQRHLMKRFDRKLDYVINTYQRAKFTKSTPPLSPKVGVDKQPKIIDTPAPKKLDIKLDQDELYAQAALEVFQIEGKASTSLIQRKLKIGYGRAARIMDKLEEAGHITAQDGPHARELVTK